MDECEHEWIEYKEIDPYREGYYCCNCGEEGYAVPEELRYIAEQVAGRDNI